MLEPSTGISCVARSGFWYSSRGKTCWLWSWTPKAPVPPEAKRLPITHRSQTKVRTLMGPVRLRSKKIRSSLCLTTLFPLSCAKSDPHSTYPPSLQRQNLPKHTQILNTENRWLLALILDGKAPNLYARLFVNHSGRTIPVSDSGASDPSMTPSLSDRDRP